MSAPPLSLGGSERNQDLKISYRRFKSNALCCYQLFQRTDALMVEYTQAENSIQTETKNSVPTYSQYIFQNNSGFFLVLIIIMPRRRVTMKILPISGITSYFFKSARKLFKHDRRSGGCYKSIDRVTKMKKEKHYFCAATPEQTKVRFFGSAKYFSLQQRQLQRQITSPSWPLVFNLRS